MDGEAIKDGWNTEKAKNTFPLGNMSETDLENACRSLDIPSAGKREELIVEIEVYNFRKSGGQRAKKRLKTCSTRPFRLQRIGWVLKLERVY